MRSRAWITQNRGVVGEPHRRVYRCDGRGDGIAVLCQGQSVAGVVGPPSDTAGFLYQPERGWADGARCLGRVCPGDEWRGYVVVLG